MSCRSRLTPMAKLKQSILKITECSHITKLCSTINNKRYIFLMYHGVVKDSNLIAREDWLQLNESAFREQMLFLKNNCDVVSFQDILSGNVNAQSSKPRVVITFDDGYANNYEVAFPILKEIGLPATIFLVTDVIGTNKIFWYDRLFASLQKHLSLKETLDVIEQFKHCHPHIVDEKVDDYFKTNNLSLQLAKEVHDTYRVLNLKEIEKMATSGLITFGSHTHQHELLTLMTVRETQYTLRKSLEVLEEIPNFVKVFCYPNGYYEGNTHPRLCEQAGYDLAVKADSGLWTRTSADFEIPRWGIGKGVDLGRFAAIVTGAIYMLQKLTFLRR